ncbi:MAG TPA: hypothetical protein DDY78_12850 [Planctomycetales bacterium]|jgi:hypothetical protein|nr:hypothetical protein [Planctomycetales bacterium]
MTTTRHENDVFDRELPVLLSNPANHDKYALIHGDAVDSVWPTLDEALQQGYDRFELEPFLIRHIVEHEESRYFPHGVSSCQ